MPIWLLIILDLIAAMVIGGIVFLASRRALDLMKPTGGRHSASYAGGSTHLVLLL